MSFFSRYKWSILLCIAVAIFGAVSLCVQLYENQFQAPDAASYWAASRQLYFDGFHAHPVRPYLFPLIIGLPYLIGEPPVDFLCYVQCLNFVAWLLTLYAIVKCFLFVANSRLAFVGGLLFATHIGSIGINGQVLTEPIFTCCLVWSAYFYLKYNFQQNEKMLFIAIGFITAASIIRPTALPIIFLLVIPLLLWAKIKGKLTLNSFIISLVLVVLPIGGQFYNMKRCFGTTSFTYLSSENLYRYFLGYAHVLKVTGSYRLASQNWSDEAIKRSGDIETAVKRGSNIKVVMDSLCQQDLKKQLSESPILLVGTFFRAIISNTKGESFFIVNAQNILQHRYFDVWKRVFKNLSVVQNIFFSLLIFLNWIVVWIVPQKQMPSIGSYRIITSVALGVVLISGLVFASGDRFHLTVVPISIICIPVIGHLYFILKIKFFK